MKKLDMNWQDSKNAEPVSKPIDAETAPGIRLLQGKTDGFTFLSINVSRLCNQKCKGCWTSIADEEIRKTATHEAIGWFNERIIELLLKSFRELGGKNVTIMADGEPFLGINFEMVKKLVFGCGKNGLGMRIFSNGEKLTEKTINELTKLNPARSFTISIKGGSEAVYDEVHGVDGAYKRVMANKPAWKKYAFSQNKKLGKNFHSISIHSYLSSGMNQAELELIKKTVKELGNVPHIVTTMGCARDARKNPETILNPIESENLIKQYATGPVARDTPKKTCSYIASNGWHDGEMYGMTLNPFYGGSIQSCPYLSKLGTIGWFSLRNYVEKIEKSGKTVSASDVKKWLEYAVLIQKAITTSAFSIAGYEDCIMRHPKLLEIEKHLKELNDEMEKTVRLKKIDSTDLESVLKIVKEYAKNV